MTTLAALAANSLFAAIWQGLLLTLAAALVFRLVPGVPAAIRSALWSAVFLLTLSLHFHHARVSPSAHHANPLWSIGLAVVWLSLSLYRASQLVAGAVHLRALVRRAVPVQSGIPAGRFRRATVCTSEEIDRPSVIGFFSPRILIPSSLYAALSASELEPVLIHETGHLRRGDDWANLLQKLALVLFPLNPVLFWLERQLCRERELACDDLVLAATRAPRTYAHCLTSLAEYALSNRTLSLVLGAWQRQSELSIRVRRILHSPARTLSRTRAAGLAAAICVGLLAAAGILARSPEIVSFAPVAPALIATANTLPSAATPASFTPHARPVLAKAAVTARPAQHVRPLTLTRAVHPRPRILKASWQAARPRPVQPRQLHSRTPAFVPVTTYVVPTTTGWLIIQL